MRLRLLSASVFQKALREDFYSVREQWVSFDPQLHHCVEPVTIGERRSLALLASKSLKRIPSHCSEEFMEIGFYLPFMTQVAEGPATTFPVGVSPNSSPFLAARLKDDELALKASVLYRLKR